MSAPGRLSNSAAPYPSQRPTKLHRLLVEKSTWDDATWDEVEQYLLAATTVPSMHVLVELAGCELTRDACFFKTDAVKQLRACPPQRVLDAWDEWRRFR